MRQRQSMADFEGPDVSPQFVDDTDRFIEIAGVERADNFSLETHFQCPRSRCPLSVTDAASLSVALIAIDVWEGSILS